jgi:dipeptidyl aminopeptidase/acylaminoacyl peptidase
MKRIVLVVLLLLAGRVALPQSGSFTIEQLMSAPFPSSLAASPSGEKLAWVFNDQGERNIWIAEAPDYEGRPLTSYEGDDGQEISGLVWTPDGKAVVYVCGGSANRQGEYPNPLSDPAGVKQEVWTLPTSGGEARRLGEGSSPAVSPKHGRVAFIRKGQIFWASVDGGAEVEQLAHTRGGAGSLRWSPDGSNLAFVSRRGDHSFIGVYNWDEKSLRFMDPSVDRDANPVWSPDGKQVAYTRVPSSRELFIFGPHRAGPPWSVRVADVSTGRGREVWKADEGRGSVFRNVVADSPLFWTSDSFLVFPWEKDGWTHLYSVPASGGSAKLLTPGHFEVEYVALGADGRKMIYNSNQDDIDRRHIWSVPAAGGDPTPLTSGTGIEWSPVALGDEKAVAFLRSDARKPAHPAVIVEGSEARDLTPGAIPADFPTDDLVEPQQVILSGADGMRIHAQLFLPRDLRSGEKRPAAVFFHGGSRRQMLLGWHYGDYYHNTYALNQYLAGRGYVALSVNFRSGIGYGMEFREALNYGATGASEFNDVLGAGLYLRSRPDVDPDRIALWGGSYGGYLTALGLARASDLFAAGVDLHGVHDWNQVIRNFVPSYDPLKRQEMARLAYESSPMAFLDTWRSPVLLIHGDDDRNVPFSESVDLAGELRKRKVEIEQLIFPDEVHGFLTHENWLRAFRAAADFLDRHIGARAATETQATR